MVCGKPVQSSVFATLLAVAAFSLHFFVTVLYLLPPNLANQALAVPIHSYMSSVFLQNWKLFSPDPSISSIKIAVRCRYNTEAWAPWDDPAESLLHNLYRNRTTGLGKVLYMYNAIGIGLNRDLMQHKTNCPGCTQREILGRLTNQRSFSLASRFAQRWCQGKLESVSAYQFKMIEFFPLQYSQRHEIGRRWGRVSELEFDVIESLPRAKYGRRSMETESNR